MSALVYIWGQMNWKEYAIMKLPEKCMYSKLIPGGTNQLRESKSYLPIWIVDNHMMGSRDLFVNLTNSEQSF